MYMPVNPLLSCDPLLNPHLPHQDAHDDMQSFYFILYHIMHTFFASGARFPGSSKKVQLFLDGCGDNKPSLSATFKEQHLFSGLQEVGTVVSRTWLRPSINALKSFYATIKAVAEKKNRLLVLNNDRKLDAIRELDMSAGQHFAEVIAEFDIAIAELAHLAEKPDEVLAVTELKVEIAMDKVGEEYEGDDKPEEPTENLEKVETTNLLSAIPETDEAPANHFSANSGTVIPPSTPQNGLYEAESPWRPIKRTNTFAELSDEDDEDAAIIPDTPSKQSKDKRPRII